MGLFGGKDGRSVRRAERAVREAASPEAYLALARVHLRAGASERALEALKRAREAFPEAGELAAFYEEVCWSHLRQRARQLQMRIDADPRTSDVVALARLFVHVGDLGRALDTLRRGVAQFGDDPQVHLEAARLCLRLWRRDLLAVDGLEALQHFARVLVLDGSRLEALVSTAEIRLQVGAFQESLASLESLAADQRRDLDAATREHLERLAAAAREGLPRQTEHDLEALLDAVEASGRPVVNLADLEAPGADGAPETPSPPAADLPDRWLESARLLAAQPAVVAVLVEGDGEHREMLGLFGRGADDDTRAALAEVTACASQACQRLSLGRLKQATVSSPGGTLAAVASGHSLVVCLGDPACQAEHIEARLAGLLAAAPEPAEAGPRTGPQGADR